MGDSFPQIEGFSHFLNHFEHRFALLLDIFPHFSQAFALLKELIGNVQSGEKGDLACFDPARGFLDLHEPAVHEVREFVQVDLVFVGLYAESLAVQLYRDASLFTKRRLSLTRVRLIWSHNGTLDLDLTAVNGCDCVLGAGSSTVSGE